MQCSLLLVIVIVNYISPTIGLYEDQAGKFDWRQRLIGRPTQIAFDSGASGGKQAKLILATEENVLAALKPSTGDLLWRRVFESGLYGKIHLLAAHDGKIITFSGQNLLRKWNPTSGMLVSESALQMPPPNDAMRVFALLAADEQLIVVHLSAASAVVYTVAMDTGDVTTSQLSTPWAPTASCTAGESVVLCWDASALHTLSSSTAAQFSSQPLPAALSANQRPIITHLGADMFAVTSEATAGRLAVVRVTPSFKIVREVAGDFVCQATVGDEVVLYVGKNVESDTVRSVELSAVSTAARGAGVAAPSGVVRLTGQHAAVARCDVTVTARGDKARLLLIGADAAVSMATVAADAPGGSAMLWTREESLADILAVEVLDLPMSATDVSIEEEFDPDAGPMTAFLRRLSSQYSQLTNLLSTVLTGEALTGRATIEHLTRDRFNLHKMMVLFTSAGKLLGMHSETGAVHWAVHVSTASPIAAQSTLLLLQRGTAHFPHPPRAALLAGGTVVTFNPITGGDREVQHLDFVVAQASVLPEADSTFLKPLFLLDSAGAVHVIPDSAAPSGRDANHKLFFYSVDSATGVLHGRAVNSELQSVPVWRVDLSSQGQTIRRVLAKSPLERVHSQGRVLADRSVLYKYSNPNLIMVLTDAPDPVHKYSTSLYLLDAVTGQIVYSHTQKRVRCPCQAVHSENWLVYSTYNERARRTELTSVDLFEGKAQSNATAFSSLDAPPQPMVERQTFIFPTQIEAMRETVTEKGITNKYILFALTSGSLVAMNRAMLDPRRPLAPGGPMEEGLPPYQPQLPLPSVAVVNYNQTLERVKGVVSSPSGLESTCLLFVHGLDLYHTRVFPSSMFDQLKDDFDASFIVLVLAGLTSAAVISRRLSQRRALMQAWK